MSTALETAVAALKDIADPIRALQAEADAAGARLDGAAAVNLMNDANWLRDKAKKALLEIEHATSGFAGDH